LPKKISSITSSTNQPEIISNIVEPSSIENRQGFHERGVVEADNSCVLIVQMPNKKTPLINTEVEKV